MGQRDVPALHVSSQGARVNIAAGTLIVHILVLAALQKRKKVLPHAVGTPLVLCEPCCQDRRRRLDAVRAVVERRGHGIGLRDQGLALTIQLLGDRVLGERRPEEAVNGGILTGFFALHAASSATGTSRSSRPRP